MVGGEQVGEPQGGALGVGQVRRVSWAFQRTHRVFGEPVVDGALIANRHAASALVVERDAQPDEFEKAWRKCSGRLRGTVECAQRLSDLVQTAENGRDAEVDPIALSQVDNGDFSKYRRG